MNTWTSKVSGPVLACLLLAGCEGGFGLTGDDEGVRAAALSSGAVTLVAPQGFCIDPGSLSPRFALMARCDTLGARGIGNAPLALITATTLTALSDADITAETLGTGTETVLEQQNGNGMTLVQLRGAAPRPELRDTYWRAATRIGDEIVGVTLYEAQVGDALGAQAPTLLRQTLKRTQAQTEARQRATTDNSATADENNPVATLFGGLFE